MDALVSGIVIAFVLRPVYIYLLKKTHSEVISAALTTLGLAAPLISLLVYALYAIMVDIGTITATVRTGGITKAFFKLIITDSVYNTAFAGIEPLLESVSDLIQDYLNRFPLLLLNLLILFITIFYYLISGERFEKAILDIFPPHIRNELLIVWGPVNNVLRGMLYGHLVVSFIIAILSGIGYYIIGIKHAPLVAALTGIAALLPIIGPYAVFIPLAVLEFYMGHSLRALAILFYGVVVLTFYSNFYLYPKLGGAYSGINPVLVLIGFISGPLAFGPAGLVYGPLAVGFGAGLYEGLKRYMGRDVE